MALTDLETSNEGEVSGNTRVASTKPKTRKNRFIVSARNAFDKNNTQQNALLVLHSLRRNPCSTSACRRVDRFSASRTNGVNHH